MGKRRKQLVMLSISVILLFAAIAAIGLRENYQYKDNDGVENHTDDATNETTDDVLALKCKWDNDTAGIAVPAPRLPTDVSWVGTRELACRAYDAALNAVENEVPATVSDTLLRYFKLGTIHAALGNNDAAVAAFSAIKDDSPLFAPIAMEQAGDAHAAQNEYANAIDAYSAALASTGLPAKYRQHIFAKIQTIVNDGNAALPAGRAWLDEYRGWARSERPFDAAKLEAAADSLVNIGLAAKADSLIERHLPQIDRREACMVIERIFANRPPDTLTTTKFLFTLASQAQGCRNHAAAERTLDMARARPDFARAAPPRDALLLSANIAYSRAQWQTAADLYGKFHADYGANSDVLMNAARANRNLDNQSEAQRWYDLHMRHFPTHRRTQDILWLQAWNLEAAGEYAQAAAAYRRVFNTTTGNRVEEAHVRHALCYYKQRQYDSVVTHLGAFLRRFPQSSHNVAAMFWQGKAYAASGKTEQAHRTWNNMSQLDPTDYHAHRASRLMGVEHQITSPASAQMTSEQTRAWLSAVSPRSVKRLTAQDTVNLRRGAALLTAAQPATAHFFLDEYERNHGGNLLLQFEMANAYALAGGPAQSFAVAHRFVWRIPVAQRKNRPAQVLAIMFPPLYADIISHYADRFGVDPLFVSAVMRQESTFNGTLVSPAGAIGLMQIMPSTGRDSVAVDLGERFAIDSLYNDRYNIRFGAYYLSKRLKQFDGDYVMALCSYNAGIHNAVKWRDGRKYDDDDVFAEDIGFRETRIYVKKVMGNYWTNEILATAMSGYAYDMPFRVESAAP